MRSIKSGIVALALAAVPAASLAQEYVVVGSHVDNVRNQHSIWDSMRQCTNDAVCSGLLSAIEAYSGVPVGKIATVGAQLSTQQDGEGTFMKVGLPAGYAYCRAQMRMTSIVPHDGPRGSTFLGRADPDGLYMETWTPVLPPGQGRSWVEGDVTVVGVRQDIAGARYASGACRPAGGRALWYCRGGGCVATEDHGQAVPTGSAPGAGSRN